MSYELVTNWKLKRTSWNSKVQAQIHEFKFKGYKFKFTVTCSNPQVQIQVLQAQIYKLLIQTHEVQGVIPLL